MAPHTSPDAQRAFHRLAAANLVFLLAVILFGAVVRITGSGAGCGQHWPSCHGELLHLPQTLETTIELSHRVTSGLTLPVALLLAFVAFRRFEKGHLARLGAVLTVVFLIGEAAIGARLVLLGLVGLNDSFPRAFWMAAHLTSTCLLTASAGLALWASSAKRATGPLRGPALTRAHWTLFASLVLVYLVAATGAITALGDTLYPTIEGGALDRLAADQSASSHFLQRVRIVHPILAVVGGLAVLWVAISIPGRLAEAGRGAGRCTHYGNLLAGLVFAQLVAGTLNIWLSAPGWMQVVHLGLACAVWLALVLLTLEALASREAVGQPE